jgi:CelD/BcsL family acetyltransferase involved in cellulose biosynthesis
VPPLTSTLNQRWPTVDLGAWRQLTTSDPTSTPFATAGWLGPWWRHWGEGLEPWTITVHDDDGQLVGAAPLARGRRRGARVLLGAGTVVGNHWDVLAAPHLRHEVVSAVAAVLAERASAWDALVLDRLPDDSSTPEVLAAAIGVSPHEREGVPSPRTALAASMEDQLAELRSGARRKVRRCLERLDAGVIEVTIVTDPEELPGFVEEWQALRVDAWAARGRSINPEHASERFRAFTLDAVREMLPEGQVLARRFHHGGRCVALAIDFEDERTAYYWLNGYEPRHQDLRLGYTVVVDGMRRAIAEGRRTYDFMLGDEAYKFELGGDGRALRSVVLTNRRQRSRVTRSAIQGLDGARARRMSSAQR